MAGLFAWNRNYVPMDRKGKEWKVADGIGMERLFAFFVETRWTRLSERVEERRGDEWSGQDWIAKDGNGMVFL